MVKLVILEHKIISKNDDTLPLHEEVVVEILPSHNKNTIIEMKDI